MEPDSDNPYQPPDGSGPPPEPSLPEPPSGKPGGCIPLGVALAGIVISPTVMLPMSDMGTWHLVCLIFSIVGLAMASGKRQQLIGIFVTAVSALGVIASIAARYFNY